MDPSVDRLSALPDDVLCRILSFLQTKLSVSTSILAKRWRFIWTHVPNLSFDDTGIANIINTVLSQHKVQTLNSFRLNYPNGGHGHEDQLETCITTVVARNVKYLHIYRNLHPNNPLIKLPRCIFTCESLVSLTINRCGKIPMMGAVCLPALKKLHLEKVGCESDESLPHLISGCPVIEDLVVKETGLSRDAVCCYVSSPTMSSLVLILGVYVMPSFIFFNYQHGLKIDTPALRHLQVWDKYSQDISSGSLDFLIEADVVLSKVAPGSVVKFVDRLKNVKCLKLSYSRQVPGYEFSALTTRFHNLFKLELASDWHFLLYFLDNADNLEALTICKVEDSLKCWIEPQQVPTCLLSHLSTITIHHFKLMEHEFDMIKYVLGNARVLKKIEIFSRSKFGYQSEAVEMISLFERESKACELVFH